jgi:ADP-ribose pyrophosphatase
MSEAHFREHKQSSELIYSGRILELRRDKVRKDGVDGELTREYIRHGGATMVVAQTASGKLILERQYRYPLDRVLIEFPAGKIDPGESDEVCAARELEEETGYQAAHWQKLGTLHPAVGYSNERIEVYFAHGLKQVGQKLDHGEYVELVEWSYSEAEQAVFDGQITDGKTIAALLMVRRALGIC